jgi:hypothetical protein
VSIVIKFFVAPDAEAAAAVAEGGPDGVFESLTFGNFDVEEALIEWEGIFTGRSFEEVLDNDVPETVVDPDDGEGPLVLAVSGTLRDALCTAVEPGSLKSAGCEWPSGRQTARSSTPRSPCGS